MKISKDVLGRIDRILQISAASDDNDLRGIRPRVSESEVKMVRAVKKHLVGMGRSVFEMGAVPASGPMTIDVELLRAIVAAAIGHESRKSHYRKLLKALRKRPQGLGDTTAAKRSGAHVLQHSHFGDVPPDKPVVVDVALLREVLTDLAR